MLVQVSVLLKLRLPLQPDLVLLPNYLSITIYLTILSDTPGVLLVQIPGLIYRYE